MTNNKFTQKQKELILQQDNKAKFYDATGLSSSQDAVAAYDGIFDSRNMAYVQFNGIEPHIKGYSFDFGVYSQNHQDIVKQLAECTNFIVKYQKAGENV